jgi:hypothetical protein
MPLAPHDAVAVFEDDGAKPSGERCRLAQRRELAIHLDKGFLRCILGKMVIAQNRSGISHRDVLI